MSPNRLVSFQRAVMFVNLGVGIGRGVRVGRGVGLGIIVSKIGALPRLGYLSSADASIGGDVVRYVVSVAVFVFAPPGGTGVRVARDLYEGASGGVYCVVATRYPIKTMTTTSTIFAMSIL